MTLGGAWQSMQPQPIVLMSFFKQKTPDRSTSKDKFGSTRQPENKGRIHWSYTPGSKAALELAYNSEALDENSFLPGSRAGRVRRKERSQPQAKH